MLPADGSDGTDTDTATAGSVDASAGTADKGSDVLAANDGTTVANAASSAAAATSAASAATKTVDAARVKALLAQLAANTDKSTDAAAAAQAQSASAAVASNAETLASAQLSAQSAKQSVQALVASYNALASSLSIGTSAQITAARQAYRYAQTAMAMLADKKVNDEGTSYRSLSDVGVTNNADGTLSIDDDTLSAASNDDPAAVQALVSGTADGKAGTAATLSGAVGGVALQFLHPLQEVQKEAGKNFVQAQTTKASGSGGEEADALTAQYFAAAMLG